MELRHLRYFVAVHDCLSFRQASERVHVTQSTLSHQIKQLEEELGVLLFERVGKRVVVTEAGDLFFAHAANALQEVDQGVQALAASSRGLRGGLRLGATHTFNLRFIPECVAALRERHSTVQIAVQELTAGRMGEALRSDTIDMGISYRLAEMEGLHFEPLYDEQMVLVVSPRHKYAHRKRLRLAELHGLPLVLLPREFATRQMLDECFRSCRAVPTVAVEMDTLAPMLSLVERSDIAAITSENAVAAWPGLRAIALEGPTPQRTPGILWKAEGRRSAPMRSFAAVVRQLSRNNNLRRSSGAG